MLFKAIDQAMIGFAQADEMETLSSAPVSQCSSDRLLITCLRIEKAPPSGAAGPMAIWMRSPSAKHEEERLGGVQELAGFGGHALAKIDDLVFIIRTVRCSVMAASHEAARYDFWPGRLTEISTLCGWAEIADRLQRARQEKMARIDLWTVWSMSLPDATFTFDRLQLFSDGILVEAGEIRSWRT